MFIRWQKSLGLMITDIDNARLYLFTCRWFSDSPVGGAGGGGSPGGGVPYDQGLPVPDGFPDRHSCSPRTRGGAQGPWVPALPRVYQGVCVWEVLCQELQKPIRKGEKLTAIRVVNYFFCRSDGKNLDYVVMQILYELLQIWILCKLLKIWIVFGVWYSFFVSVTVQYCCCVWYTIEPCEFFVTMFSVAGCGWQSAYPV